MSRSTNNKFIYAYFLGPNNFFSAKPKIPSDSEISRYFPDFSGFPRFPRILTLSSDFSENSSVTGFEPIILPRENKF